MTFELGIFDLDFNVIKGQIFEAETETKAKTIATKELKKYHNEYYALVLWNQDTDEVHRKHLGFSWLYQGKLEDRTLQDISHADLY